MTTYQITFRDLNEGTEKIFTQDFMNYQLALQNLQNVAADFDKRGYQTAIEEISAGHVLKVDQNNTAVYEFYLNDHLPQSAN